MSGTGLTPDHTNLGLRFFEERRGELYSKNGALTRPWKIGRWYDHEGPLVLCESGFHYCRTIREALLNRQGYVLALVEIDPAAPLVAGVDGKYATARMRVVKRYPVDTLAVVADLFAVHAAYAADAAYADAAYADAAARSQYAYTASKKLIAFMKAAPERTK